MKADIKAVKMLFNFGASGDLVRREFNIPVILVTHDLPEAYAVADKIIVYSQGRIAQIGSPHEIHSNPADTDVSALFPLNPYSWPF